MKNVKEFIDYYIDEFGSGDLNNGNYIECLYYLQGFMDSYFANKEHGEDYNRMWRCVESLRGAENVMDILHRESQAK